MTLQEILRAKGIGDDIIESIVGEMKQNKIFTTQHENMDVRYPKLKGDFDTLTTQHNTLLASNQDAATLQETINTHETTIAKLTEQLNEQRVDAAMDRKLTSSGAKPEDLDYLKFQWKKKGDISLDDNGEIKGGDDAIAGLKTQHPVHFASEQQDRELQPHRLHEQNPDSDNTVTKEQFEKMGYNSRVELKQKDPELYTQLMKG